jgi:hypothetical protein
MGFARGVASGVRLAVGTRGNTSGSKATTEQNSVSRVSRKAFRRSLENNDTGVSGTRRGDCFFERREFRWASLPRQIAFREI